MPKTTLPRPIALIFLALCFVAFPRFAAAENAPATDARQAYLKLIDRPRVDPKVEEKELPAPNPATLMSRIEYTTQDGQRVPALVLRPANTKPDTRLPVVIALHGTSSKKESNLTLLKTLAAKGFIAVAPDGRYHGERKTGDGTVEYFEKIAKAFEDNKTNSGTGQAHPWLFDTTWDVMRLVDVLIARPDVDAAKIGLIGFSKGGMETYLTACADERIAVAVPCIGVQSFKWGLDNENWKGRVGTVKGAFEAALKAEGLTKADAAFAKKFYDRVIPGIDKQFDCPSMLPLMVPRPLMIINGDIDDKTPLPGVLLAAEAAKKAFEAAKAADRFSLIVQEKTGHQVRPENLAKAVEWFEKWLK